MPVWRFMQYGNSWEMPYRMSCTLGGGILRLSVVLDEDTSVA